MWFRTKNKPLPSQPPTAHMIPGQPRRHAAARVIAPAPVAFAPVTVTTRPTAPVAIDPIVRRHLLAQAELLAHQADEHDHAADRLDTDSRDLRAESERTRILAAGFFELAKSADPQPEPAPVRLDPPADRAEFNATWQMPWTPSPEIVATAAAAGVGRDESADLLLPFGGFGWRPPSESDPWAPDYPDPWAPRDTEMLPIANGETR